MKESTGQSIVKEELSRQLHSSGNAFSRYRNKVLGANKGIGSLILFELCQLLFCNLGGAPGYVLRKMAYRSLFKECAGGVIWGKGIVLRAPGNITIGEKVAIDDLTQLDGGQRRHVPWLSVRVR